MPKEYEFMKSAKDKEMSDGEYITMRDEYDKKANIFSKRIQKLIFVFLGIYAVSYAVFYVFCAFGGKAGARNFSLYAWLAVEFFLAIFLYDPKAEDDKKLKYETDKKILLNSVKNRINSYKIKLGLVIGFGTFFLILNIACWLAEVSIEGFGAY